MNRERLKIIKIREAVARNRTTLSMVLSHRKGRGFCRLYRPFSGKLEFGYRWVGSTESGTAETQPGMPLWLPESPKFWIWGD